MILRKKTWEMTREDAVCGEFRLDGGVETTSLNAKPAAKKEG